MTEVADKLIREALQLDPAERAAVIEELLSSGTSASESYLPSADAAAYRSCLCRGASPLDRDPGSTRAACSTRPAVTRAGAPGTG